jgi:hypothetical protein
VVAFPSPNSCFCFITEARANHFCVCSQLLLITLLPFCSIGLVFGWGFEQLAAGTIKPEVLLWGVALLVVSWDGS